MSEDYLAQAQPTQTWNTARGVWEKQGIANLLCEHWELFSETWPTSGTMRNGKVYALPTLGPRITDSEFSSLPTQDTRLMPTPNTMDHLPARTPEAKALNKGKGGYANVRETVVNDLIPTPAAIDYKDGTAEHERDGVIQTDTVARAIFNSGEVLLPTTTASDWKGANHSGSGSASSRGIATAVEQTAWGKFEPAIRRWEQTLGRPAPLPTKPDGKEGAHRLSSAFTEWMMGLPEGWVTGVGLTRNEELKGCGNGVVPQQAELALRILLEGVTLPQALHMVSDRIEASQGNVIPDPQTDNETIGSISLPAEEAGNNANN